ncbi:MAG TPA: extracellular solute-binding protein [Candidatus Acidoferrales bacterium]|nr:extracellular solute-binding protein [Candidatus Acidoferrales bacterium]
MTHSFKLYRILFAIAVSVFNLAGIANGQNKKPASLAELAAYVGPDREQILFAGAKSEGKVVWYTSLAGGSYKTLVESFEAKYPGVKVEVYRAGGPEITARVMEEAKANRYLVDAMETTEEPLTAFREAKLLTPFSSPFLRNFPAEAKEKASGNLVLWTIARESYVGFAYNKEKVPATAVPKNFDGLLNPELKGRMVLGTGGTGPEIVGAMLKTKGDAFVRKLKGQEIRLFTIGSPAIRDQIATGEIEAAPIIFQTHALEAAEKGGPVAWLAMDIVPVHAGGAILGARPPHPHAALLMVDFLLSRDGQSILERFKYGSAAKDYGFKRWYPQRGLTGEQFEREATKWEKLMNSIVRKGS